MGARDALFGPLGSLSEADGANRPFEVFVQNREDQPFTHVGSVRATDHALALVWAKEVYTRRSDCVGLWVAPRDAIWQTDPAARGLFRSGYEKEYRRPGFFSRRRRELTSQIDGAEVIHAADENVHGD
jgi:ring-1,2-phenylacetyl-CoA epoxidase subunit PaaB